MIPAAAKQLLDFIGEIEADGKYNAIYGFNQHKLAKPLVQMTIAEVQREQPRWTRDFGSSAAGKYQIMHATLNDLIHMLDLDVMDLFDPNMQDRLGYALLRRRGFDDFMAGRLSMEGFGNNLAKEWASFPVLTFSRGAHRDVGRGESYYAGDAVNKALVAPNAVETVLMTLRAPVGDGLTTKPPEATVTKRKGSWIAVVVFLIIAAAVGFALWRSAF